MASKVNNQPLSFKQIHTAGIGRTPLSTDKQY